MEGEENVEDELFLVGSQLQDIQGAESTAGFLSRFSCYHLDARLLARLTPLPTTPRAGKSRNPGQLGYSSFRHCLLQFFKLSTEPFRDGIIPQKQDKSSSLLIQYKAHEAKQNATLIVLPSSQVQSI
ncbi:hypothetical protein SETIT_4G256100v2 [Setaria italica]|uniref:Uncharacterized protein n=1 Tax=Setaria italica TaxID=4555 RepID=A0A368QYC3_SETIT|nr:hypothetical protein SETIT_4G256100v2 [Setaria italica]